MTSLRVSDEVESILAAYVPGPGEKVGKDQTVRRMQDIMAVVGNPERDLSIIHLAGTSGKTSTAYFIAKMLQLTGRRVGLTVSPHIDNVTERVQINLTPLSDAEFKASLLRFMSLIQQSPIRPYYFELLTVFAYWYFAESGVDYAVVETGIGGLYDSTNIARNTDKLCVVTDIGRDHTHLLGETLPDIARQKAGIIHPGNTAIMFVQNEAVMQTVKDWCRMQDADLLIAENQQQESGRAKELPEYQQRNWALAREAFRWISRRDNLPVLTSDGFDKSARLIIPGRMDRARAGGKTIVMDGAHNEQKMQAFAASFSKQYPDVRVPVLLSLKQGKSANAVLEQLRPVTSKLIITAYRQEQGLPIPAWDAQSLADIARAAGFEDVAVEPDSDQAYALLRQTANKIAIITGSFYLIGQLRSVHPELR